jgi:hypothetical protein
MTGGDVQIVSHMIGRDIRCLIKKDINNDRRRRTDRVSYDR